MKKPVARSGRAKTRKAKVAEIESLIIRNGVVVIYTEHEVVTVDPSRSRGYLVMVTPVDDDLADAKSYLV